MKLQKKLNEAKETYLERLRILEKAYGRRSIFIAPVLDHLAEIALESKDFPLSEVNCYIKPIYTLCNPFLHC